MMVFPSLGLSRDAFLTVAELGTQELRRPVQLRVQLLRPTAEAGGALSGGGWWLSRSHRPWSLARWTGIQP